MADEGSERRTVIEKVMTVFEAVRHATESDLRSRFIFWLGGVSKEQSPDGIMLLDLFMAGEITPEEAISEEPAKWVRMISDLDEVRQTPLSALKKWREMNPIAQSLVVEKIEGDRQERIAKGLPTEPTAGDRERLKKGDIALALGEPQTNREVLQQLEILHSGIAALNFLDDLGSTWANKRAQRDLATLLEKYARLQAKAATI
jgi:hypothetical protein